MTMDQILTDQATDPAMHASDSELITKLIPIHSAPPEILSDIFLRCLPVDELPRSSPNTAPILLTHVCSLWRNVAVSTPDLWCRIEVGVGAKDVFEHTKGWHGYVKPHPRPSLDAKVLEQWTRRSGSMPLTVHIGYPAEPELSYDGPFEIIRNVAHRWRDMLFGLPTPYLQRVVALIPTDTPLLESFAMNDRSIPRWVSYRDEPPPKRPLSFNFVSSPLPLLQSLSIRAAVWFNFNTQLNALQTLSLDHCRPSNSLEILRNCPNIEELTLVYYDLMRSDELPRPESIILLSRLQKFRLVHERYNHEYLGDEEFLEIGKLLRHLCLPSLKSFFYRIAILPGDEEVPAKWNYLSRLILRSNCSIEDLEFETIRIDAASMVKCLRLSPGLKHLGVTGAALGEKLVNALTTPLDHTITTFMCPLLESFHLIHWDNTRNVDLKFAMEIARSRLCLPIGHQGRVARFSFIYDRFHESDLWRDLKRTCVFRSWLQLYTDCIENGLEPISGIKWREDRKRKGLLWY
ncbi:hypothetical protein BD410DRAFT_788311 [Rickenella mellea]|uniref:Uncharacterized protein n=1 Tax=Rickenella mellea TaxID=50990 RepID=A0A4Y7Q6J9_9AGAM|nr:hypothetical protein BD410DRAFT_788311 [Rickenella mellea]